MPLYAILHTDIEGLHDHSCTLVTAASRIEIVQQMIANPHRWHPFLAQLYPDDGDPRSVWCRVQSETLLPETVLTWIDQSYCTDNAEMLRIQAVEPQSLAHLRVQTRWISAQAPESFLDASGTRVCARNSEPTNPSAIHAHVPETIKSLMAAYIQLRQQKGSIIAAQLVQLKQQVLIELQSVQQQEIDFTAQQTQLLEHLCPHLAIDARTLSTTSEFQQFVRSMFAPPKVGVITRPLQVLQNPIDWALNTLPHPLQLHPIETLQHSKNPESLASVVQMQVNLGDWSQTIAVPIDALQDGLLPRYQAAYTTGQWLEVAVQLEPHLTRLPIASYRQVGLAQELVCLLAYIGELFNTTGMVDRLNQLPV
ncbi:hypothetical protein ACQ4M3_42120 [Leptolyngbya sp. AN03gr2]|uniref:hypothetical protein n=1 Tax=unclassified Leptolyngbya TaxID=2650499 RepID=UPI003D31AD57